MERINWCILLFYTVITITKNERIITIYYDTYRASRPAPLVHFPQEHVGLNYYINTYLPYSILDKGFDLINESKHERIKNENGFDSYHYITTLKTDNVTIKDFSFNYIDTHISEYRNKGLGFAHKYLNESFSIIHRLYSDKHIEHVLFSFEPHNTDGYIHFGGVPDNKHKELPYEGIMKVNVNEEKWMTNFTGIEYEGRIFDINIPAVIHSGVFAMMFSDDLFDIMVKYIFNETINNKECYNRLWDGMTIQCREENKIKQMSNITFIFGNTKITYKMKDIFDDDLSSLFRSNPFEYKSHGLILGIKFLRGFNYSIFNYEDNQIELYSDRIEMKTKEIEIINRHSSLLIVMYITIIILGLMVSIYINIVRCIKQY